MFLAQARYLARTLMQKLGFPSAAAPPSRRRRRIAKTSPTHPDRTFLRVRLEPRLMFFVSGYINDASVLDGNENFTLEGMRTL
jgi:hypothetical protein